MPKPVIWENVWRHHSGAPRVGFTGPLLAGTGDSAGSFGGVDEVVSIVCERWRERLEFDREPATAQPSECQATRAALHSLDHLPGSSYQGADVGVTHLHTYIALSAPQLITIN
jgi:hypothetical protein